ncbi:MAG: transcription elongation factor GreA [Pseudomonadota bacterium]|nr:transcription elongation factor GreA [Pseudomonadota bacterium]|tara:strand:+ start:49 stop:525 length:477 start_codon:yes stop_codon:yes gene_type:complete
MNKTPMTITGAEKLKEELYQRKNVLRQKISKDIAEARAHGDLKENAEYHAAREQASFNEGRIADIESKLSNCEIIDISKINESKKVVFGCTVQLENIDTGESVTYKIVGEDEADIKSGLVSYSSPVARAIIGKMIDDIVVVKAPKGETEYEIIDVSYI